MDRTFEEFYREKERELFEDLSNLIAIPSVAKAHEKTKDAPYGTAVKKSLDYVLQRGKGLGFETVNYDNQVGEIIVGSGKNTVGVLCHVDVVDAGDGWTTDPFKAELIDGELYGRGVIDDKGPLICSLYAMKFLEDYKLIPDNCRIKMIIGTDEEEDWESISYYLQQKPELPSFSIVPDANFPVIYCEKGLVNLELTLPIGDAAKEQREGSFNTTQLSGGERSNVVAANAMCRIESSNPAYDFKRELAFIENFSKTMDISIDAARDNSALDIKVHGRAAHAMTPEKGKNAISYLMKLLKEMSLECETCFVQQELIDFYAKYIDLQYDGKNLGLKCSDKDSGDLTINVGILTLEKHCISMTINLRYPVSYGFNHIKSKLAQVIAEEGASIKYGVCMDPIFFPKDSPLVETLMDVYRKVTGDETTEPIALGGATYARAIPQAIAFGPVFPTQEELAHEADEHYTFADYKKITEIYADAIMRLFEIF